MLAIQTFADVWFGGTLPTVYDKEAYVKARHNSQIVNGHVYDTMQVVRLCAGRVQCKVQGNIKQCTFIRNNAAPWLRRVLDLVPHSHMEVLAEINYPKDKEHDGRTVLTLRGYIHRLFRYWATGAQINADLTYSIYRVNPLIDCRPLSNAGKLMVDHEPISSIMSSHGNLFTTTMAMDMYDLDVSEARIRRFSVAFAEQLIKDCKAFNEPDALSRAAKVVNGCAIKYCNAAMAKNNMDINDYVRRLYQVHKMRLITNDQYEAGKARHIMQSI